MAEDTQPFPRSCSVQCRLRPFLAPKHQHACLSRLQTLLLVVVVVLLLLLLPLLPSEFRPRLRPSNPLFHLPTINLDRQVRSSKLLRARKIRRSTCWRPE